MLEQAGTFLKGKCQFVGKNDDLSFEDWKQDSLGPTQSADSAEFGHLAHKRWKYYRDQSLVVESTPDLLARIRQDPRVEVGMMCQIQPDWDSPTKILGIAFFRRTWANSLVVDFLATHPAVQGKISGIGIALLDFIVGVATAIKASSVWGETTKNSVRFYEKAFGRDRFGDRFFLPKSRFSSFRTDVSTKQLSKLTQKLEQVLPTQPQQSKLRSE